MTDKLWNAAAMAHQIEIEAHAKKPKSEAIDDKWICVWCGCDSDAAPFVCSAPDGNGHLFKGPRDRERDQELYGKRAPAHYVAPAKEFLELVDQIEADRQALRLSEHEIRLLNVPGTSPRR